MYGIYRELGRSAFLLSYVHTARIYSSTSIGILITIIACEVADQLSPLSLRRG